MQEKIIVEQINNSNLQIVFEGTNTKVIVAKVNNDKEVVYKVVQHNCGKNKNNHMIECRHLQAEFQLLKGLNHPNIIKLESNEFIQESAADEQQPDEKSWCGIIIEKCSSDFYKVLQKSYPQLIKFQQLKSYFFQVASALQYLHKQQIYHFDIKLENILIDSNNQAKISDFGLSCTLKNCQDIKILKDLWSRRTRLYMPKEASYLCDFIDQNDDENTKSIAKEMDWEKIDVFQFGVAIFNGFFLYPPFQSPKISKNDLSYRYIYKKTFDKFWNQNDQFQIILDEFRQVQNISEQQIDLLKDLIQQLISYNPLDRPNFNQILKHAFFKN